jgi:hypothetical protein
MKVSTRRLRKNINIQDAQRAYQDLLANPSNTAIDDYAARFNSPGGSAYTLTADDYDAARYLLAVVHCSYIDDPVGTFTELFGLKLNNSMDSYRTKLEKIENLLVSKNSAPERRVTAPATSVKAQPRVLSPMQQSQHDIDSRGGQRVRFI